MLSFTTNLYEGRNIKFGIYGTEAGKQTKVFEFVCKNFNKQIVKKLTHTLNAIDSDPMRFSHEQKFKHLEGDVWEIKFLKEGIRIACLWENDKSLLIGFYAFKKESNKWPPNELVNMRNEKAKYIADRTERKRKNEH